PGSQFLKGGGRLPDHFEALAQPIELHFGLADVLCGAGLHLRVIRKPVGLTFHHILRLFFHGIGVAQACDENFAYIGHCDSPNSVIARSTGGGGMSFGTQAVASRANFGFSRSGAETENCFKSSFSISIHSFAQCSFRCRRSEWRRSDPQGM